MIASNEGNAVGISDFEGQQEQERFHGVVSAVDEVAKKKVILIRAFASDFKEFDQIVKLPMNVPANLAEAKK